MMWDELAPEEKNQVARLAMAGSKPSPENLNRVMSQLANNPRLADRYIQEAGLAEQADPSEVTEPIDEAEPSAEQVVDEALTDEEYAAREYAKPVEANEGHLNVGYTPDDKPYFKSDPREIATRHGYEATLPGETAEEYVARMSRLKGRAPQMPGRRPANTDVDDD